MPLWWMILAEGLEWLICGVVVGSLITTMTEDDPRREAPTARPPLVPVNSNGSVPKERVYRIVRDRA